METRERSSDTEAALLRAHALDQVDAAIVGTDLGGTVTLWSGGLTALSGWTEQEALGQPLVHLAFPPEGQDAGWSALASLRATGRWQGTVEVQRKDGHRFWVSVRGSVLHDSEGEPVGLLGVATDASAEVETQNALWHARDYLAAVTNSMGEALFVVDSGGRLVDMNPAAERLLGWDSEALRGRVMHEMTHYRRPDGSPFPLEECPLVKAYQRGESVADEDSFIRSDGSSVPVAYTTAPFETQGGNGGTVVFFSDLIEHRRNEVLEGRLDQAQRLESLGQLAGGIAHDFNNLLAVILNYAAFVAEHLEEGSPNRADVEEIRKAAERASELTHQLLTFGRREVVTPQTVRVDSTLREAESLLTRTLGEQVILEVDIADGPQIVSIGAGQLDQVLLNVAVNARDAMPAGGTLRVRSDTIDVDSASGLAVPPCRYVRLSVCDSGSGMAAEVAAQAFDPFFTTKPTGEGTGLGLATVYGLVNRAGGHVELASRPGHGTEVTIYLPAVEGTPPEVGAEPLDQPASAQRTAVILLVEDDQVVRGVMRRILAHAGHEVIEAIDGKQALEISQDHEAPIDLLLTDIVMPGMSGRELAARLRADRPDLRVLCVSGYERDDAAAGTPPAQEVVLQKPFVPGVLAAAVARVLGGAALMDRPGPEESEMDIAEERLDEADQTLSDKDQTLAERDQTASDRDQQASTEDQAASDAEVERGADPASRAQATAARNDASRERTETSALRDQTAEERDWAAQRRDELSILRDQMAQERDLEAAEADARELAESQALEDADQRARILARQARATADRERAAGDRARAARDRERAAEDRAWAAQDRAQAGTDELTGARRREVGIDELENEMRRARREGTGLVAAYVDVDELKRVNDAQGHAAGDDLLKAVTEGLRKKMRSYDLIVRLGGDEFLCALPNVSIAGARRRFDSLRSELAESPGTSVSIGFAELVDDDTADDLVKRADRNLLAYRQAS